MTTAPPSGSARPARRRSRSKAGPAEAVDAKPDDGTRLPVGEMHFRRFAESSKDVFWLADLDSCRLLYVSPRFEALWGIEPAALIDDPSQWNRAVEADDADRLPQPFFADAPGNEETVREYRIAGRDGRTRWIRDRRFALRDGEGGARIGGIAEDVTERKQREIDNLALLERERCARADAEAATQAKDEFLAVVTHELRSPLNAIRGWSHVLRHGSTLQPMQLKALDAIDRNTQAQAHLVDDLLDSQRILCGTLQLDLGRVPLAVLVEEAIESVRPAATLKRIRLEASHDPSVTMVMADADRLRQALAKLLSNAVKFTPEDGIVSVATRRGDDGLAIEVRDTGIGIEPSQLPLLFGRFQQGDSSNARRANGLGLGLTLAQQLVELHGGRLAVHSEGVGHGSTFTIELPAESLCSDALAASPQPDESPLAGKRIVIVEDDDDGREVLGLILRNAHVELQSFDRAADAYEYLAHVREGERPDALISDIAMPDEDGYAFIRRVREMEGGEHRPHIVALALTSFARVEDRIRALKAGFDAHVAKPIDPERVLRTLVQALGAGNDGKPMPA
jgi:PAS domain S-box-containing protein